MTRKSLALLSAASLLALSVTAHAADPDFTVLDWAGWEIDGMLQPYVDKNGQKPSYVFFADDDEAFQKVSSGFKADVVHPCAAAVPRYIDAGLIEPWCAPSRARINGVSCLRREKREPRGFPNQRPGPL